ncbi:unnamed protein product [Phytophthora fragariaefolia]|uniref:Unnamed protein product n=1 Tax=Phytophthora fragariaefolia TaxID=1490495 RepID=A0A9W6U597_9STRA|nr:unnamed protein product [Phytophthora fragariaefolia]
MDAFVDSLFAPDMRSAVAFPPLRNKRLERAVPSPPGSASGAVPPPPNSLLGGGIAPGVQPLSFQPPSDDSPLFVRLHEDAVLSAMLSDQDFPDLPKDAPRPALLEPLALPLKDAFGDAPYAPRGSVHAAGLGLDGNVMPVFPVAGAPAYLGGGYAAYAPMSPAAWLDGAGSFQRVHAAKQVAGVAALAPVLPQHQPSPGAVDMFSPQHADLWISTLRGPEAEERDAETAVERPPFSLTISPPASLTNKALKELIVSADFATPPLAARPKRPRAVKAEPGVEPRAKMARTTSASPVTGARPTEGARGASTLGPAAATGARKVEASAGLTAEVSAASSLAARAASSAKDAATSTAAFASASTARARRRTAATVSASPTEAASAVSSRTARERFGAGCCARSTRRRRRQARVCSWQFLCSIRVTGRPGVMANALRDWGYTPVQARCVNLPAQGRRRWVFEDAVLTKATGINSYDCVAGSMHSLVADLHFAPS